MTTKTTTAPILERARQHAAGAALNALDKAQQTFRDHLQTAQPAADDLMTMDDVADELIAGKPFPASLRELAIAADNRQRAADLEGQLIKQLREILKSRRQEIGRNTADTALRYLHTELGTLMDRIKAVAGDVRGIRSADDAIRRGTDALTAYAAATAVVDDYTALRKAQIELTTDARGGSFPINVSEFHQCAFTREPSDPDYLVATGQARPVSTLEFGNTRITPEEWPEPAGALNGNNIIPSANPVAYLVWLADRGDYWVPTSTELSKAIAERARCMAQGIKQADLRELDTMAKAKPDGLSDDAWSRELNKKMQEARAVQIAQ